MSSKSVHHLRSRASAAYRVCTWILYLLCLCAAHAARAQTPAGDACLAEGNFSHYSSAEVSTLQNHLAELYPQAGNGAEGHGRLQPDGRLGPITLYWLQRFCTNFALNQTPDLRQDLPERLEQLLQFATLYRPPTQLLTSLEFVDWASRHPRACDLDVRATLAGGSDAELLQLLSCYLSPEPAAPKIQPRQPPAIFVLKSEDIPLIAKAKLPQDPDSNVDPEPLITAITAVLEPLIDIQYPTSILLHRAIQTELLRALSDCRLDGVTKLGNPWRVALQPYFPSLQTTGEDSYCSDEDLSALKAKYDLNWRETIESLARKPLPPYEHQTIAWQGGDCGCVPPLINTTGYGIYPYWQIEDESQQYDFSVFSRVAYYGLTADNKGELRHLGTNDYRNSILYDHNAASRAFIETARRHGSQVDWIIEKDWFDFQQTEFSEQTARDFFDKLATNLLDFLEDELNQPSARFRSWYTLGAASRPRNGDGITLYLKNYPISETARKVFNDFFDEFKSKLREKDKRQNRGHTYSQNTYLNLLVDQQSFIASKGALSSANILRLFQEGNTTNSDSMLHMQAMARSLALVLLESPHGDSLDQIYDKTITIERALILPTFMGPFHHFSENAERDDPRARNITYVQEGFGGVGFWPITASKKPYLGFNTYIADRFADLDSISFWTRSLCPHRWLLLGILNGWLLVTFIYLLSVFYLSPHRCRSLPRPLAWLPHPITVALMLTPPIVLWLYLLLADPLFGMLNITGLLVLVIVAMALWAGYKAIKTLRRPTPNRSLLRQLNRLRPQND
jgi:hypothetical protein